MKKSKKSKFQEILRIIQVWIQIRNIKNNYKLTMIIPIIFL